jgi:hypothetical protein
MSIENRMPPTLLSPRSFPFIHYFRLPARFVSTRLRRTSLQLQVQVTIEDGDESEGFLFR